MVNVERFRQELKFVTRNRKHHNQGIWFAEPVDKANACGTTGCLAGWTGIHHAKNELRAMDGVEYFNGKAIPVINYEPIGRSWTELGAELLGLEYMVADELFHESNTLWDLWNIANLVTHGEIEIPAEVEATFNEGDNRTDDPDAYIFEVLAEFD